MQDREWLTFRDVLDISLVAETSVGDGESVMVIDSGSTRRKGFVFLLGELPRGRVRVCIHHGCCNVQGTRLFNSYVVDVKDEEGLVRGQADGVMK
jgi:hypothetical protein